MNVALTLMQQHWKARNAFDAYVIVPGPRVAAVSAAVGAAAAAVETVAFAVAETEAVAVAAAAPQHAS